ncbi:NADPH-dependent 7-cyano-7-deazaguanine reductase [Aeropyrum camini]|uniref:GTP cyclohydrolase I n=2 Tax=Aeropyrum camini TaxID=229980 RepID=U3TD94_9CREN|nr:NADPH-dependent 7-cyano-7-deazaguanine reductase [Aeropyrum camini]BAN90396.1 GTP cyclohydrolase I [Aeropyrum camini SY1 = JCM 12091]
MLEASVDAVCPFTGAPDSYDIEVEYVSREACLEALSLASWLEKFRGVRISQEQLAQEIVSTLKELLNPEYVCVKLTGSHGRVGMVVEKCEDTSPAEEMSPI